MDARSKIGAGVLGISAVVTGAVDATTLREVPLERLETIAEERVEARQIENRVETTFPWKDQNGLKVVYDMGEPTIGERFRDKRKREVITEVVDFGEGGFKIDILLHEKPDTNRFCYLIEGAEQYDFFYQPEVTDEEAEQFRQGQYDTRTLAEIKSSMRSDDAVGSYAVYHKELKDHRIGGENYATGKVMHIPRPQVWELNDEENTKEWAELSYFSFSDGVPEWVFDALEFPLKMKNGDGVLCVTARQEFLDDATYPVRIDPTFGYTTEGAFSAGILNTILGYNASPSSDGTVDSISVAIASYSAGAKVKGALYLNSTLALQSPQSAEVTLSATSWNTLSFTGGTSVTSGTTYKIAAWGGTASIAVKRDSGGGTGSLNFSQTYSSSWPNPLPSPFNSGDRYSIYVTYTESGGGSDSCTYSGSGDWNVLYSDNCAITEDVVVSGACNFNYDGAGSFSLTADITCQDVNGGASFEIDGAPGANIHIVN